MMSIITVSRGSYARGKEVAEKTAQKLGFKCISREVLIEASEEFGVPEIKLLHAVRDAPSILDRFTFGKERYTAYLQAALLTHLQQDNVIYHGLAGHYFVRDIPHVLKVRIIGKLEDRIKLLMRREEVFQQAASALAGLPVRGISAIEKHGPMSEKQAAQILEDLDEARRKWGIHLYGIDTNDCSLYDLVIHLDRLSPDDAVDMLCNAIESRRFQTTPESQRAMDDLLLAARVKATLIAHHPRVQVASKDGVVQIVLEGGNSRDLKAIQEAVARMPEVGKFDASVRPIT
ncbi:MAG: cytidylate kinase-like family protein, partial [Planctomycetota bacterium]